MSSSNTIQRALSSKGTSQFGVYKSVARLLNNCNSRGTLVDVGCGEGLLWQFVKESFDRYVGIDLVRFPGFPIEGAFYDADLDQDPIPLSANYADVVVSVETVEHLENPRAFLRELVRILKPRGFILITTPNQLSLLSKLTLVVKNEFNAFQEAPGLYPAHITALLESDLIRMGHENNLNNIATHYSGQGRMPFSSRPWPQICRGRLFSDNVILSAQKPDDQREPANRSAGVTASIYADRS